MVLKKIAWLVMLAAFVACTRPSQAPETVPEQSRSIEGPSKKLVAVDSLMWRQPDSGQFYIAATGDYVFTVTLSNGDEYYGEFTVTD